ncbi:MAG: polysaccharide deacetylase family protein [Acutalibacteraceae bacterium]
MFKILKYKNIAFISVFLCLALLLLSVIFSVTPIVTASNTAGVKVPIVMYHQISENSNIWGKYVIPTSVLEEDFKYLKEQNITPISFKDLELFVKGKKTLPKNPIIITFDDGERSFLTKVVPLLEKYGYTANVNIVGSLVDLYTENGDTDDRYAYLNDEDIKILSEHPLVELGCHTYNMHSLSGRRGMGSLYGESNDDYIEALNNDFDKFNEKIYNLTGNNLRILAYPYGIKNSTVESIAKEKGYSVTLTCGENVNVLNVGDSLYNLGRFNRPYGVGANEFFEF